MGYNKLKKMAKQNLESIEYFDECIFRVIALSTNKKAIEFRIANPQIDFHLCRFNCPVYNKEGCCDNYTSLFKLNFIRFVSQ